MHNILQHIQMNGEIADKKKGKTAPYTVVKIRSVAMAIHHIA